MMKKTYGICSYPECKNVSTLLVVRYNHVIGDPVCEEHAKEFLEKFRDKSYLIYDPNRRSY